MVKINAFTNLFNILVFSTVNVRGQDVFLCPQRHFCDVPERDLDPKCECEERCLRVGSCCIDYLHENNRSLDTPLEMASVCVKTTPAESVYLVNVCNATWFDSSIKAMCKESANPNDILRNLPVSGPNGIIHYKNVYCAMCNYVNKENVITWEVTLQCNQTSNITTLKNIGNECSVEYRSRASLAVRCDVDVISSCADTYSADSEEARKCQGYSAMVNINGKKYKNPHCVSCNNMDIENINCSSIVDEAGPNIVSVGFGIAVISPKTKSLSVLFDFSSGNDNVQVQSDDYVILPQASSCKNDEIYDPFEEICRSLTAKQIFPTCESSSLLIDFVTTENLTSSNTCLTKNLNINEKYILNISKCRNDNCFNVNMQIVEVNSSLPREYKSFLEEAFLGTDKGDLFCNISFIEVMHLCYNVPRDICYDTSINPESLNQTYSGIHDIHWRYSFHFDTHKQAYSMPLDNRVCRNSSESNLTCPHEVHPANSFHLHPKKTGHIVHIHSEIIYGPSSHVYLKNGSILVCQQNEYIEVDGIDHEALQGFLTRIFISMSLAALLITFILYCRFKALRTLPGKSVMNLIVALFLALLIFFFGSGQTQHRNMCKIVAILQHYFWLASFFWMNVLSFDVRRTFTFKGSPQNAHRKRNTLILYSVYAWGSPAVIVGVCLGLIQSSLDLDMYYGNSDVCIIGNGTMNLIAFGGPVALTLSMNVVFFIMTVISIRRTKQVTKTIQNNNTKTKSRFEELIIYAKLSTLMGMSWIFGFLAAITGSTVIWYVYVFVNSLQGVFFFVFFVCNQRVFKLMKGGTNRTSSNKTRSTDYKSGQSDREVSVKKK
ncbi:uncharacterized protein [Antedon mediterranea]|uniref:uncharacterized protein n=1 Tax=Antedon mediterranea TaxID=105859 RepID=UPI003AF7A818